MALGSFYDEVIDKIDSIVEAHQGVFDLVKVGELPAQPKVKDIVSMLEDDLVFVTENRQKLANKLPAIDNLLQDLEQTYMSTLYKLKNLE